MSAAKLFHLRRGLGAILLLLLLGASRMFAQGIGQTNLSVTIIAPTNDTEFPAPPNNSITITAAAADYGAYPHFATFYANGVQIAFFVMDPLGPSETNGQPVDIDYTWTNVVPGNYNLTVAVEDTDYLLVTSAPVNVTVEETVPAVPVISIVATTRFASESQPGIFTVYRTGNTNNDVNVFYSIGGLVTEGVDYAPIPDPILIPAGATSAQITITLLKNPPYGTENPLVLQLTNSPGASPTSYLIGIPSSAEMAFLAVIPPRPVVTIIATDPIAIASDDLTGIRPIVGPFTNYLTGNNTATFLVRRTSATAATPVDSSNSLTVYYSIAGTAVNGVDYVEIPGTVTIPTNQNYAIITITPKVRAPSDPVPIRTVILSIYVSPLPVFDPVPYYIGWPGTAAAIIFENVPAFAQPVLSHSVLFPDGVFDASLPGNNGRNYCLQVSSNGMNWTSVCTNPVVKNGIQFVDPEMGQNPSRLYRAIYVNSLPQY